MIANKTNRVGGETATGRIKVLLYDVESSPNVAYIWNKYEQNALGDFIKERQIISVAWKWLGEKEVHVIALPSFKSYKKRPEDNEALVRYFHKVISKADIVIGHNVAAFDDKMVNTDFLFHGLRPPPPHKTIDTLRVARSRFRFNSNKLGDLGARLGLGKKVSTGGFDLWVRCLRGDNKAWALMMKYNKGDVVLLEKIYLKLRPWMTNHPDMNAVERVFGCPVCRSKNTIRCGWHITMRGRQIRFKCKDCGKWSLGKLIKRELRLQ